MDSNRAFAFCVCFFSPYNRSLLPRDVTWISGKAFLRRFSLVLFSPKSSSGSIPSTVKTISLNMMCFYVRVSTKYIEVLHNIMVARDKRDFKF